MRRNYCALLEFLAFECNVLYVGKECKEHFLKISSYFASKTIIDLNEKTAEIVDNLILQNNINLVVLDVGTDEFLAVKVYEEVKRIDDEISILALFNFESYEKIVRKMPRVDGYLFYPIEEDMFYKKMFMILGRIYLYNMLSVNQEYAKPDAIEEGKDFFDAYKERMLFVADDLAYDSVRFKHGELSDELLKETIDKLNKVVLVFNRNSATVTAADTLSHFVDFLSELELSSIHPKNLYAFGYLADILNEMSVYLNQLFIEKTIRGVKVFNDSIKNNIEFMKKALTRVNIDEDKDGGELDFF